MISYIQLKKSLRACINPEFKKVVKQAKNNLAVIKEKIDNKDKQKISLDVIKEQYYEQVCNEINYLLQEPDQIAEKFSLEEHLLHKEYYRDQLAAYIIPTPLHHRALAKPFGYPGDFQIMNMLYDPEPFFGETSFFKLVNAASCQSIGGKAVAERTPYYINKFSQLNSIRTLDTESIHVMSLGSGPAVEIQQFILNFPDHKNYYFYLIDQDSHAIEYSRQKIDSLQRKNDRQIKIQYYNDSFDTFFIQTENQLPPMNLIYCSGLFDYLENQTAIALIEILFRFLANNGELVIGNLCPT